MVKNLHASVGDIRDMDLIPRLGRSPEGEHDNTKSQTRVKQLPCTHTCKVILYASLFGKTNYNGISSKIGSQFG